MPLPTDIPAAASARYSSPGVGRYRAGWFKVVLAWLTSLAWAGTIYWFSSRTGPQIEEINVFELSDKVAHFIAFVAGGPPLVCALRWSTNWEWRRIAVVTVCILACYGAADEYHQTFTVNRTGADFWDGLADALGGLAGTFASIYAYARLERSRNAR